MQALQNFGGQTWLQFNNDLASCGVQKEYAGSTAAWTVDFLSTEIVVPHTTLFLSVARFNFFYWLWYYHICHPNQLQGKFKPGPATTKGFFTFKPSGARDPDKVDKTLGELLTRTSREILVWAKQLGDYVEARMDPLRKVGPIVE